MSLYPLGETEEGSALVVVSQRLGCKGSDLSLVNFNGRGEERDPIGKVLLNKSPHKLVNLWGKNDSWKQVGWQLLDPSLNP